MVDKKKIVPINDTTFEVEMPSGDKVEMGDRESAHFKPSLKLNRWGGECFVKVGLPTTEKPAPIVEAGRVKWRGQKVETQLYPLKSTPINELGGFEFEIVLKEKPVSNQIVLDIQAQGLRFSYQPPLTQEEIDRGDIRPDNVVGSYAVYHATKKNNRYMTGKAFHIYRPIVEDALGNKSWCSLHIDEYINPKNLTITVPQQFLDEAVYPVTIDPTFGYTTIGVSTMSISDMSFQSQRVGPAWAMPVGEGGSANYIRAHVGGGVEDCKVCINQKDSGGAGIHDQIATKENLSCVSAYHWEEFTLAGERLTGEVVYILNIMATPSPYFIHYDKNGVGAIASYMENYAAYVTPDDPWVLDAGTTYDHSIYCNYLLYKLEGVTKDKNGNVLTSCKCYLLKDNLDDTLTFIGYALSDAVTGAYSFMDIGDNDAQYIVVAFKDNTPHVFDVTDHVLQPVLI